MMVNRNVYDCLFCALFFALALFNVLKDRSYLSVVDIFIGLVVCDVVFYSMNAHLSWSVYVIVVLLIVVVNCAVKIIVVFYLN